MLKMQKKTWQKHVARKSRGGLTFANPNLKDIRN